MRSAALIASLVAATALFSSGAADAQSRDGARVRPAKQQKCLRALNGACVNAGVAEAARVRAAVIPSVRVSYFGTPAGTVGGRFIPFERLFQDNPILYGLPTANCTVCVVRRSR